MPEQSHSHFKNKEETVITICLKKGKLLNKYLRIQNLVLCLVAHEIQNHYFRDHASP